jgi:carbonic anhydrase
MNRLIRITKPEDVFPQYRNTPISMLLEYHNLNREFETYSQAQMLISMCMDNRKHLNIPDNFAFILRSGGGNLTYSEFKVSFAVAIGNVKYIAIIAHNKCGMVNLVSKKAQFINGLVEKAGWSREKAEEHFKHYSPMFEIGNEIDFVLSEAKRLRTVYPQITVVPMYYKVEDNHLYLITE